MITKDEIKIILGLDQSSNKTGFSVFVDGKLVKHGLFNLSDITLKSSGNTYYDEKVHNLKMFLEKCIEEFNVDLVAIEDIQAQKNAKTFKSLAYLQGVLKNYMYENHIPFCILPPKVWKKQFNIKGKAREVQKANTQKYVKEKFGVSAGEDECDSICIGQACCELLEHGEIEIFQEEF